MNIEDDYEIINGVSLHYLKRIIKKSSTTTDELYKLLHHINLDCKIDWDYNFDENEPRMILNIGEGVKGTHWVAVDNINKCYFDSFGMSPPIVIPRDYSQIRIDIQDINFGRCGSYCVLFLYYSNLKKIKEFYDLFTPITT
jgi:hypothetical protein